MLSFFISAVFSLTFRQIIAGFTWHLLTFYKAIITNTEQPGSDFMAIHFIWTRTAFILQKDALKTHYFLVWLAYLIINKMISSMHSQNAIYLILYFSLGFLTLESIVMSINNNLVHHSNGIWGHLKLNHSIRNIYLMEVMYGVNFCFDSLLMNLHFKKTLSRMWEKIV